MAANRSRLDRLISRETGKSLRDIKYLVSQGRVWVDGAVAHSSNQLVDQFSRLQIDEHFLPFLEPIYVMLNKPIGVVSATKDDEHTTAVDLIRKNSSITDDLHIPGRLDFNSSGLLLLTNDGRWSKQLSDPECGVTKVYEVTTEKPIKKEYVKAFEKGMFFEYENITTRPVDLDILSDYIARVSLTEGRYHQIRRMFGHFQNKVIALKRISVGNLRLDEKLMLGESRALTAEEVKNIV